MSCRYQAGSMAFRATRAGRGRAVPLLDGHPSFSVASVPSVASVASVAEHPAKMDPSLEHDPSPLAAAGLVSWCWTAASMPRGTAQDCSNPEFQEAK